MSKNGPVRTGDGRVAYLALLDRRESPRSTAFNDVSALCADGEAFAAGSDREVGGPPSSDSGGGDERPCRGEPEAFSRSSFLIISIAVSIKATHFARGEGLRSLSASSKAAFPHQLT